MRVSLIEQRPRHRPIVIFLVLYRIVAGRNRHANHIILEAFGVSQCARGVVLASGVEQRPRDLIQQPDIVRQSRQRRFAVTNDAGVIASPPPPSPVS